MYEDVLEEKTQFEKMHNTFIEVSRIFNSGS